MKGDILYRTERHIVTEGEEMVRIQHLHKAANTLQALEEENDYKETLEQAIEAIENECPKCGGDMIPTCLGCGGRFSCTLCDYTIPCGCTDYEI